MKFKKRGLFFSMDVLLAFLIVILVVIIIYPVARYSTQKSFIEQDVLDVLTTLKVGEVNNTYVEDLIGNGTITNLNKTMIEQIGEFYVTNISIAKKLAEEMILSLNTTQNIGIWYGHKLLASKNSSPYDESISRGIEVERKIISGIRNGSSVTGYSARAYLSSNVRKKYYYFGGYIGDGNISLQMNLTGDLDTVDLEIAANTNFSICINDDGTLPWEDPNKNCSGHFAPSDSEFEPKNFPLDSYYSWFSKGINIIEFIPKIDNEQLYIAGGHLKITYSSNETFYNSRYHFPGVGGIINVYDGFYIPGQLNNMEIFLHLDTNFTTFLTIGNTTVFRDSTDGEENITINDTELSSLLDYSSLVNKTIPLRLGTENASYLLNLTQIVDVFSVVDLSGSMNENEPDCSGSKMIGCAKDSNKNFISNLLKESVIRVGLVGFNADAIAAYSHNLTRNESSLNQTINSWGTGSGNCICCGINNATNRFLVESEPGALKTIVVMSDGKATTKCSEQGTGNAETDAIQAACDAWNNHEIIVYSVAFGDNQDRLDIMRNISDCGNGTFYHTNITNLSVAYDQVTQEIIDRAYKQQTANATGGELSTLYPDSYIQFNYTKNPLPYGLIITTENKFYNNYTGNFSIPDNSTVVDVSILSYSGSRWTDYVEINNISSYNLSAYGSEYLKLGDPYSVNIPVSLVDPVANNIVNLTTSLGPTNSTYGSEHNKIVYTIIKEMVAYSEITGFSSGCNWTIEFEDDTNITTLVPDDYSGDDQCYYTETTHSKLNSIDPNDAKQSAVFNLLELLDFDGDGKIDVKFSEQYFDIGASEVVGIPFSWATEVKVIRWT